MSSIRVLIADDHSVLRAGLRALLEAESDLDVVGEAVDGADCVDRTVALRPDVVLMDVNMPRSDGLTALREIGDRCPSAKVLILTMLDDLGYLRRALASGGSGYVLKEAAGEELLRAIRTVHDGGVFLHPHHAKALAQVEAQESDVQGTGPGASASAPLDALSDRENEVFRLIALGHRNAEIAESMFLSVKTIETYKARLMKKLDISTRAQLVRLALRAGVLDDPGRPSSAP